jgi:predicted NBD/HSP70 family sugar kinase
MREQVSSRMCLACDFGGSSVKYALVDDHARICRGGRLPAPLASVRDFQDALGGLYQRFKDQIAGIGISMPGYIDPLEGFLHGSGVYQSLYGQSIPDLLREACPVDIAVENDGKCGALAEVWGGALRDVHDGAVVILGSGVAGGIVSNGRIHSGKGFTAGEFSYFITGGATHTYLDMAFWHLGMLGVTYKLCKLKNLDLTAQDAQGVLVTLDESFSYYFPTFSDDPAKVKADGKQLLRWVDEGDVAANQVYKEFIDALAVVIFNVQVVHAPERIVIGGGLSRSERVISDVTEELNRYYVGCDMPPTMQSEVVRSVFRDECNLIGAAHNFFSRHTGISEPAQSTGW